MANQTEPMSVIIHICGHSGSVVTRCADAYQRRYCDDCASVKLPKPSECLRRMITEKGDSLGPMLGPIGAVIYARQSWFNASGMLAWSGTDALHEILDNVAPSRQISPYVALFETAGL